MDGWPGEGKPIIEWMKNDTIMPVYNEAEKEQPVVEWWIKLAGEDDRGWVRVDGKRIKDTDRWF